MVLIWFGPAMSSLFHKHALLMNTLLPQVAAPHLTCGFAAVRPGLRVGSQCRRLHIHPLIYVSVKA